jgi:phospholipase C
MTEAPSSFNVRLSRRKFIGTGAALAGAAALAGYLPERLAAAAASTPSTFDLSQVKHIVYLMQENRSFDHYFGTYPKARGFSDPTAITLANGNSVFKQPDVANPAGFLEPFHMSTITTGAAAIASLGHSWDPEHNSWNQGKMDRWVRTHMIEDGDTIGAYTMGYLTQEDIPFHWALAQHFSLLDNYHCSVMGPTYPNRLYWMTGMLDPSGTAGGPVLETAVPKSPLTWTTAAETLYNAGYGVKVYAAAQGSTTSYLNVLVYFANFMNSGALPAALYQNIVSGGTVWGSANPSAAGAPASPAAADTASLAFEEDCANGTLPDVSWIMPVGNVSEHPPSLPAYGAQFIASKLEALAANEELWNSTVFVLNYDENDGFFDHVPPPVPEASQYPEEFVTIPSPLGQPGGGQPIGAGFRVPCVIISPWTVGGNIYSNTADHTSCLQLIEQVAAAGGLNGSKAPVNFSTVTQWRRDTFDDLTGALVPGAPQPAPSDTEFEASTMATYVANQANAANTLPMPPFPGRTQNAPTQLS